MDQWIYGYMDLQGRSLSVGRAVEAEAAPRENIFVSRGRSRCQIGLRISAKYFAGGADFFKQDGKLLSKNTNGLMIGGVSAG
jgi:hypothetical protein